MTPRVAVLILAGGRSSRMGTPKANVMLRDGRAMIAHVIDAVKPLGLPIHLSVGLDSVPGIERHGLPVLRDAVPLEGPLMAIAYALEHLDAEALLVVGCDQPLLTQTVLRKLLESGESHPVCFCWAGGTSLSPIPGLYPRASLKTIRFALARGERSPRRWLQSGACRWVTLDDADAATLRSFNSRADLEEANLLG